MTPTPTPEQAAAQVALIRRDRPDARVIGIHTPGPWLSSPTLLVQGETLPVLYCISALQVSEALVSHPVDAPPLVVLTPAGRLAVESGCAGAVRGQTTLSDRPLANGARPLARARD